MENFPWNHQYRYKEETEQITAAFKEKFKQKERKPSGATDEEDDYNEHQHHPFGSSDDYLNDCSDKMMPPLQSPSASVVTDSQGLIVPKKLMNPCLESSDRQNLHRELMFNQKIGKSVLNQKSELQRALQKQKERQMLNEQQMQQQQQQNNKANCAQSLGGELSRVIMQRAQRLESLQNGENQQDELNRQLNPEYLNARAKLRATIDSK